jgi:hypothetical protein
MKTPGAIGSPDPTQDPDPETGIVPDIFSPDRMTSTSYLCAMGLWADKGGIHFNSGVNNKAASLLADGADGGTFNEYNITGLGITKTAHIYYEVQSYFLKKDNNYFDLANALVKSCNSLELARKHEITKTDCTQVKNVIAAVEMKQIPCISLDLKITGNEVKVSLTRTTNEPIPKIIDYWAYAIYNGTTYYLNDTFAWTTAVTSVHQDELVNFADAVIYDGNPVLASTGSTVTIPSGSTIEFHVGIDLNSNGINGILNNDAAYRTAKIIFTAS